MEDWDLIAGRNTVAVLALTTAGEVVIARQYRPGPAQILDELPGGYIDEGETPSEAAERELLEETGFAGRIEVVGATWLAGNARVRRYAAVARECVEVRAPTPDAGERVEVHLRSMAEFRELVRSGAMTDLDIAYRLLDHLGLMPGG